MKISMTIYNFFPFKKQTKNDHEFSNKNKYGEDETLQLELDDYYKKKLDVAIDYTYPQKSS